MDLERLITAADEMPTQGMDLSFYLDGWEAPPEHKEIVEFLGGFLNFDQPWDAKRAAALLDCDPGLFSQRDMELALRAIWKSGRVGFYWGGNELYRNGWVSKLLRCMSNLREQDAILPAYPDPSEIDGQFNAEEYWKGFNGYLPQAPVVQMLLKQKLTSENETTESLNTNTASANHNGKVSIVSVENKVAYTLQALGLLLLVLTAAFGLKLFWAIFGMGCLLSGTYKRVKTLLSERNARLNTDAEQPRKGMDHVSH